MDQDQTLFDALPNNNVMEYNDYMQHGDVTQVTQTINDSSSPPHSIEWIDLTLEEIEDQIIAVDDYDACYKKSLAMRELFPSLNTDIKWTGKWLLKPGNLPNMNEVKMLAQVELYTDETIDWDNWNSAVKLALEKIALMEKLLEKFRENMRKLPQKRPFCSPYKIGHNYACIRCKQMVPKNMVSDKPHIQECRPKRHKRFHPYIY